MAECHGQFEELIADSHSLFDNQFDSFTSNKKKGTLFGH